MHNRPRPRLARVLRKLSSFISISPEQGGFHGGALDSPRQREVQLELDLFTKRPRPWSLPD